jgi:hypothetical protein
MQAHQTATAAKAPANAHRSLALRLCHNAHTANPANVTANAMRVQAHGRFE